MTLRIKQATKQGYVEIDLPGIADLSYPKSKTRRGRVQNRGGCSPTITCNSNLFVIEEAIRKDSQCIRMHNA